MFIGKQTSAPGEERKILNHLIAFSEKWY